MTTRIIAAIGRIKAFCAPRLSALKQLLTARNTTPASPGGGEAVESWPGRTNYLRFAGRLIRHARCNDRDLSQESVRAARTYLDLIIERDADSLASSAAVRRWKPPARRFSC